MPYDTAHGKSVITNEHMLTQISALIHYHYRIDPDDLSFEQIAKLWGRLKYGLLFEGKLKSD